MPTSLLAALVLTSGPFAGAHWLTVPRTSSPIEQAQWIWVQPPGQPKPTALKAPVGRVTLTKRWTLVGRPRTATIWFTSDNESRVTLNGRMVGKSTQWETIEKVNVSPYLQQGENLIEVEAVNGPGSGDQNPGGFILAAAAESAGGKTQLLLTDSSWQSPDGVTVVLGDYFTSPWNKAKSEVNPPVFVGSAKVSKPISKAVAKVIGLGHFDLLVNGQRQGEGLLNQPWSQYDKTIYYHEFDVTRSLKRGSNKMEALMGNSFYRVAQTPGRYSKGDAMPDFSKDAPYLFALVIDVTHKDGSRSKITTDRNWKWKASPFTYSHVFGGEDYDARELLQPRMESPVVIAQPPKAELLPITWPLFRQKEVFQPVRIQEYKPGVWSYSFPQNAMAIVRMKVKGRAGQKIELTPSEVISPKGEVQQLNLWGGRSGGSYTLVGRGLEEHEWRFFYHGFQFVQMTGGVPVGQPNPSGLPVVESLELVVVRTDNEEIGRFETSKELLNKTHSLIDWAMKSNMGYALTDCPHREKLGWLECSHLLFRSFAYRYDSQAWIHKICRDIREIQLSDGRITTVAPDYLMLPPSSPYKFTIEWGAAGVLLPWQAYEWYGDRRFLTENYSMMKRFVDWIDRNAKDGLAPAGLGDWYDYGHGHGPGPSRFTPTDQTATAMWAMCAQAVAKASLALGKKDDAAKYEAMGQGIKEAFLRHFYNPQTSIVKNNGSCQTANSMALCAGLIPEEDRGEALDRVIEDLKARDWQQTSGDVGHLFLIRALAEAGRSDVLHKVYSRTGVGSYGGIIAKGLTTLPETWDAITVGSNSLNHCMLGHAMEWLYGYVLGIRQAPGSVGWKALVIAPEFGDLASASGGTRVPQGEVSTNWWRHSGRLTAQVEIPKGVKAELHLPSGYRSVEVNGMTVKAEAIGYDRLRISLKHGRSLVTARLVQ